MDARIRVSIDVTRPLKMKKKVVLDNGEEVTVSFVYEKLYRYCFTNFMISHEERDCPHISDRDSNPWLVHIANLLSVFALHHGMIPV